MLHYEHYINAVASSSTQQLSHWPPSLVLLPSLNCYFLC